MWLLLLGSSWFVWFGGSGFSFTFSAHSTKATPAITPAMYVPVNTSQIMLYSSGAKDVATGILRGFWVVAYQMPDTGIGAKGRVTKPDPCGLQRGVNPTPTFAHFHIWFTLMTPRMNSTKMIAIILLLLANLGALIGILATK